ncbi:MAG: ATP-binding protein [Bacteroidota bacterium]|nr:ATP-binding protein [Bacteroidota bacterium]
MEDIKADIHFIGEIFEHQPEAAVWLKPVSPADGFSGERQIVDFQFHYCNSALLNLTGKARDQIIGRCVLEDKLPDPESSQTVFEQCLRVYETGQPEDYSYFSYDLGKCLTISRVKVRDGVLTTARNRTEEYRTEMERDEQTKFLTSVVENSPYGICLYESVRDAGKQIIDFKLRLCNRKSSEITALTLDQLYSMTVQELMAMRGHSGYFEICKKVVETGEAHYMEFYSAARDQWLGFSFVKFEDGYLLNYIDITETKRYERAANQNANELNAIFNGSLSAVYSARLLRNKEGKIYDLIFLRVNESFYRMFSNLGETIVGKSLMSIAGNDDQSVFMQFVQEVVDNDQPAVHTLRFHNPERWYEFSMVMLDKETISVTLNEITVQKMAAIEIERIRQQLEKSVAELKRSNANLEDFVYAASHDLKEPIRKIQFYTGQLEIDYGSFFDEKGLRMFNRLKTGAERMKLLVDDLLEYSLANQGIGKFEEISLQDTIGKVLEDLELSIREKNAAITMNALPLVKGNERQIQQLFQNLIDNALKYHRPGTDHQISISAGTVLGAQIPACSSEDERLKPYHLIEIEDNGIGFEQKDADRIFHVFTRLHGKEEYQGSGVGLSIVRKVVENHHGFAEAIGRPGEGATFRIFLPV